jgi:hypothetical protein
MLEMVEKYGEEPGCLLSLQPPNTQISWAEASATAPIDNATTKQITFPNR